MNVVVGDYTFVADAAGAAGDPLVLMLHGFPQTKHTWRHQLAPLAAAGFYAVAPNQRGYSPGARPHAVADYATVHLVNDALALASALGYDAFHLVGHDWGGQIAWLTAVGHPDRVRTLTVLSRPHPAAFADSLRRDTAQSDRSKHHRAFQDPTTASKLLEDDARRLRRTLSDQGVPAVDVDAYLSVFDSEAALDAALNWYRAGSLRDGSGLALGDVAPARVPTTYIWGDADGSVGRVAAEATAGYVDADYRFEELAGVGHFVTDQTGARVTEVLLERVRS